MDIASGVSALKVATDLTRTLRDRLKGGEVKPDEIAGRIGEIYDYIVDSKDALIDAKDEIQSLKDQIRSYEDTRTFSESLIYDDRGIYIRREAGQPDELYCSACLDATGKRVRLIAGDYMPRCHIHGYRQH